MCEDSMPGRGILLGEVVIENYESCNLIMQEEMLLAWN